MSMPRRRLRLVAAFLVVDVGANLVGLFLVRRPLKILRTLKERGQHG